MTTLADLYTEVFGQPSVSAQLDGAPPRPWGRNARQQTRPPRSPRWNAQPQAWEALGQQPAPVDKPADGDPTARYHQRRLSEDDIPRGLAMQAPEGQDQIAEAGQALAEATGLPQVRRSAEGFTRGIMSGSPDMDRGWGQGWSNAGLAALNLAGTAGVVGDVASLGARSRFQLPRTPEEPVTPLPVHPPREIGPGGLPIAPRTPFRNSLRGSNDDLAEAAAPRADATPDARPASEGSLNTGNDGGSAGSGVLAQEPVAPRQRMERFALTPEREAQLRSRTRDLDENTPLDVRLRIDAHRQSRSMERAMAGIENWPPERVAEFYKLIERMNPLAAERMVEILSQRVSELRMQELFPGLRAQNKGSPAGTDPPPRPPWGRNRR